MMTEELMTRPEMAYIDSWLAVAYEVYDKNRRTLFEYVTPTLRRRLVDGQWKNVEFWPQLDMYRDWPRIERAISRRDQALAIINAAEAIWAENGCWSRFFLVTNGNGHVHRERNCPTCYPTTRFAWLVELAGADETEMVATYGSDACTVCFPSAPTMKGWGSSKSKRDKQAAKDERAAKAAARRAKEEAKQIDLKVIGVRTVNEAISELGYALDLIKWSPTTECGNPEYRAKKEAAIPLIIAALAVKFERPEEEILAEYTEKSRKRKLKQYKEALIRGSWPHMTEQEKIDFEASMKAGIELCSKGAC
jgi:hypothetical protein